jgi:antitoxin CptB
MTASEPAGVERRRLLWRCRRGMKELDVLLERYAQRVAIPASAAARGVFARLLAMPDPELAGYLLGQDLPRDPALAALVQQIRRCPPAGGEGG